MLHKLKALPKSKKILISVLVTLILVSIAFGYFILRSNARVLGDTDVDTSKLVSSPISYTEPTVEEKKNDESNSDAQAETPQIVAAASVQPAPQTNHVNPQLPSAPNLPVPTNPEPQPIPPEITEDDRCDDPENTWLEFQLGIGETQQFGGNGTQYTFMEGTDIKINAFPNYSCIDISEITELWYNATTDSVHCYCGQLYTSGLKAGTYEMIYLLAVRDEVLYDYITLTMTPKPPANQRPNAVIHTPRGYMETKIIEGNSHTFNLYGEMQDPEDGVITSGSSLKWYRAGETLSYLFDSSGQYTVTVPNCTKVEVTIVLRVWDSGNYLDDEAFTVFLQNENCV